MTIDVEEISFEADGTAYVMVAPSPAVAIKISRKYSGLSRAIERLTALDVDAVMWMASVSIKDVPKGEALEGFVFGSFDAIAVALIEFVGSLMRGGRPRQQDDESAEGNVRPAKARKG